MEDYEKIVMNTDSLDDGSVVVNFDIKDDYNISTQHGGYVMVKKDDEDKCFSIVVIDVDGNTVSETHLPFKFEEC